MFPVAPLAAAMFLAAGCGGSSGAGGDQPPIGMSAQADSVTIGVSWQYRFTVADTKRIAVCNGGQTIYALSNEGHLSVNFQGAGPYSTWFGGGAHPDFQEITCSDQLYVFDVNRNLWRQDGADSAYNPILTYIGNPAQTRQLAVSDLPPSVTSAAPWLGNQTFIALTDNDSVWWSSTGADNSWNFQYTRADIDGLTNVGGAPVALTYGKDIIMDGSNHGNWQTVSHTPNAKFLTSDGVHVYTLNTDGSVYLGTFYLVDTPPPPPPPPPTMPTKPMSPMPVPQTPLAPCPGGEQTTYVSFCVMCPGDLYGHEIDGNVCSASDAETAVEDQWEGCSVYDDACSD